MADLLFHNDIAALYNAVSKGDGIELIEAYAAAAKKAVGAIALSAGPRGGMEMVSSRREEKIDEYFSHQSPTPFHVPASARSRPSSIAPSSSSSSSSSLSSSHVALNAGCCHWPNSLQQPSWRSGEVHNSRVLSEGFDKVIAAAGGARDRTGQEDTCTAATSSATAKAGVETGKMEAQEVNMEDQDMHPPSPLPPASASASALQQEEEALEFPQLDILEEDMRFLVKLLSDARAPPDFAYSRDRKRVVNKTGWKGLCREEESAENDASKSDTAIADGDQNNVPLLFDGSNGGNGSLIHLACIVDSPFALAALLVFGAEVAGRHTAFRRLAVHEASCCGSIDCLTLLLEIWSECGPKSPVDGKVAASRLDCNATTAHGKKEHNEGEAKANTGKTEESSSSKEQDLVKLYQDQSQSLLTHAAEVEDVSFLTKLKRMLELAVQVEKGLLSELDAARALIRQLCLPRSVLAGCASSGPAISVCDGHGNTALHWAAFKNECDCVAVLLAHGADPNARAQHSGWTALHDASYSDAADAGAILLAAGAHVDARANSGATPLCFAAQEDSPRAVALLLRHGADASVRCCGQSSLNSGNNANTHNNVNNNHHNTNHHRFAVFPSRFSGYTPLHYCAHYNAWRAANVLIQHGVPVEMEDLSHRRPIHVAVARGSSDVLRGLLTAGATVEVNSSSSSAVASSPHGDLSLDVHQSGDLVVRQAAVAAAAAVNGEGANEARAIAIPIPNAVAAAAAAAPLPSPQSALGEVALASSPVASPVLKAMVPSRPIQSNKPWNCLSQRSIDECNDLLNAAEGCWSPETHKLFSPSDRKAVLELLLVGKRFEQLGTGIFLDMWPYVLSFCGRGWFRVDSDSGADESEENSVIEDRKCPAIEIDVDHEEQDCNQFDLEEVEEDAAHERDGVSHMSY